MHLPLREGRTSTGAAASSGRCALRVGGRGRGRAPFSGPTDYHDNGSRWNGRERVGQCRRRRRRRRRQGCALENELGDGCRVIQCHRIDCIPGQDGGRARGVCEHLTQGRDIFEFGCESSPYHIVAACHHLHTVPIQVCVRLIGAEEDSLPRLESSEIQQVWRKHPHVAWEGAVQSQSNTIWCEWQGRRRGRISR
jgi:hypothetical protein